VPRFRYDVPGRWLKGNTHVHTTASDGGKSLAELTTLYAGAGYDFLCCTDHWVASHREAFPAAEPLLWLEGVELDGRDEQESFYHIVCLGRFEGLVEHMGLARGLEAARRQGAYTILAHPHWSGNSFAEALRYRFDGVEIYNHQCRWLNGKGDGTVHWNAMLAARREVVGLAVDDAHIRPDHPGWNGGWISVLAPERTEAAILAALRAGTFYSSCGPRFDRITWDGARVRVETSAVSFIRLVGPGREGARIGSFDGQRLDGAELVVPLDWPYVYVEIEDDRRRRAWTNPLFVGEPPPCSREPPAR
jgi:hypothetical protein